MNKEARRRGEELLAENGPPHDRKFDQVFERLFLSLSFSFVSYATCTKQKEKSNRIVSVSLSFFLLHATWTKQKEKSNRIVSVSVYLSLLSCARRARSRKRRVIVSSLFLSISLSRLARDVDEAEREE